VLKVWNRLVAKLVKWLHNEGLTKNEVMNVGGYRYPVAEFLAFSDDKITDILRQSGATEEQVDAAFVGINEMRRR
jgi:hypothetical protein